MPDGLDTLNDEIAFMYDRDDSSGQAERVETEGGCSAVTIPACASIQVRYPPAILFGIYRASKKLWPYAVQKYNHFYHISLSF